MSTVFIALQANEETRPIIEAIQMDNPEAVVINEPAMVKINCEGSLMIKRETIEELIGRDFDIQEIQINLITLSGHVEEDEDFMSLSWDS